MITQAILQMWYYDNLTQYYKCGIMKIQIDNIQY